jgi:hypothetical protein
MLLPTKKKREQDAMFYNSAAPVYLGLLNGVTYGPVGRYSTSPSVVGYVDGSDGSFTREYIRSERRPNGEANETSHRVVVARVELHVQRQGSHYRKPRYRLNNPGRPVQHRQQPVCERISRLRRRSRPERPSHRSHLRRWHRCSISSPGCYPFDRLDRP